MRTTAIQFVVGVIVLSVFHSKCESDSDSGSYVDIDSIFKGYEGLRPPDDLKKTAEKTEASVPKEYVILGNKYIKTIFDDDYGKYYVADWTRENGVRCDFDNEEDTAYADKLCAMSCSNNDTMLATSLCFNGWVTCLLGFNENGKINTNMNCEPRDYEKKIPDGCLSWCLSACQKNHLPTASVRPYSGTLDTAARGCNKSLRKCACAPFKEGFQHPIPSLKSKDIANYIEKVNTTYFKKKHEIIELLYLVNYG